MLSKQANTQKARSRNAARLLLVLCWAMVGVLILVQALPALISLIQKDPITVYYHSSDEYIPAAPEKAENLLDVNQAQADAFDALPGIGPVYSQAIVEYRETISSFHFLEDLMNVKGIGKKRLEAIRPFLMEIVPSMPFLP